MKLTMGQAIPSTTRRKTSNTLSLAVSVAVAAFIAGTGPAQAEDLLDIYRKAQHRDAVFEAARHAMEAAAEKVPQARAALLPTLSLNGNNGRQKGDASFSSAPYVDRQVRSSGASLQLSQPIFRFGSWIAYEQADAQVRQSAAQFAQVEQELILRVAQAYFDVLVAQESVTVAVSQLNAVEQQLGLAKRNYEVGMATVTDVHEAKSRFDLARAQRISAVNEHDSRQAELERILGEAPGPLAFLRKDAVLPHPQPADMSAWLSGARDAHPLVRIQQAAQEVAEKEVEKSRAGHLPTLDLTASYGSNFSSGSMTSPADIATRSRSAQVGLQLSIPVFSGGGTNSRVREAASNLSKAGAELEAARRQAVALARQAFAGVTNGHAQIEALASAVESSKSSVDANKIGYKIGTRINIDVLNAEQQFFAAQRDLVKARTETLMQGLRLKAATGSLAEADVEALNRLLEYVAN